MNLLYVTSFYEIYEDSNRFNLFENIKPLLLLEIPLVFFTSEKLHEHILENYTFSSKVKFVVFELENAEPYAMITSSNCDLPGSRNVNKDTKNFMGLMNSKSYFLKLAEELFPEYEYYAWIDAGIMKIVTQKEFIFNYLRSLSITPAINKILIPGCHTNNANIDRLTQGVWWKYCGGFLIAPKHLISKFYTLNKEAISFFMESKNFVIWEVNIWCYISQSEDIFEWYSGNHNDSIFFVPPQFTVPSI